MARKKPSGASGDFLQKPWTLRSSAGTATPLQPFLQSSGDLTRLAEALKTTPDLLWNPLVYRIIQHLREVRSEHWDDAYLGHQAGQSLHRLIEAAASGLLGGTWLLKRPPGPPGRRPKRADEIDHGLLEESRTVMEMFRKEDLRKRRNESPDQRDDRVARIVKGVWESSSLAHESLGVEPLEVDEPATIDDLLRQPLRWKTVPPPPAGTVLAWVKEAYRQSLETGRPVRSQLVWKMLGQRYGLTTNQVRHRIDTAARACRGQTQPE